MIVPVPAEASRADPPIREERLLIVDLNVLLADAIATAAMTAGFKDARVVNSVGMALRFMQARPPTMVLADLDLAAGNGFDLLRGISRDLPETQVVLIVDDSGDQRRAVDALVVGASISGVTMSLTGGTQTISPLPGGGPSEFVFTRDDVLDLVGPSKGDVTIVVSGILGPCTFSVEDTIKINGPA